MKNSAIRSNAHIAVPDPQVFCDPRRGNLLPDSDASERRGLATVLVIRHGRCPVERDYAGRPQLQQWSAAAWHDIRDSVVFTRGDGGQVTVQDLLTRPANGSPNYAITSIMELLLEARARRSQLLEQIAALDSIEHLFAEGDRVAVSR